MNKNTNELHHKTIKSIFQAGTKTTLSYTIDKTDANLRKAQKHTLKALSYVTGKKHNLTQSLRPV